MGPIPTNAALRISYATSGYFPSPLGEDVVLLDGDAPVAARIVADMTNDIVVRPSAPLLPNHTYRLADRRTVPCYGDVLEPKCVLKGVAEPVVTFTTGEGPDLAPPTFDGIADISVVQHLTCDKGACCGPYDAHLIRMTWAAATDDHAGAELRYRVYRHDGTSLEPIGGYVEGTTFTSLVSFVTTAVYCMGLPPS